MRVYGTRAMGRGPFVLQESVRGAEFFSCPVFIASVFLLFFVNTMHMFNTYYLQK